MRYRGILLAIAILGWVFAVAVLFALDGQPSTPSFAKVLFALCGIAFLWGNGAFWWLELRYPHVQIGPSEYVSRTEQGSKLSQWYSSLFFGAYGLGTLFGTLALLRTAIAG